jgi:hypothetical protein
MPSVGEIIIHPSKLQAAKDDHRQKWVFHPFHFIFSIWHFSLLQEHFPLLEQNLFLQQGNFSRLHLGLEHLYSSRLAHP